jgi:plastocyanin
MTWQSRKTMSKGRATLMVAALAVALASAGAAPASTGVSVTIKDFTYGPPDLTVPVGTKVTWRNRDEEPHTVTAVTGAFTSAGLSNDETFARTFTQPGTYQYFCALHPKMHGTVVVR